VKADGGPIRSVTFRFRAGQGHSGKKRTTCVELNIPREWQGRSYRINCGPLLEVSDSLTRPNSAEMGV
jgi:hypothetical protein